MTTRRHVLLTLPLLCAASRAGAQEPKARPLKHVGYLAPYSDPDPQTPWSQRPFYIAMRKKGWVVGENLMPEPAFADWKLERLAGLAEELVRKRVDVILCDGDLASLVAARATRTIPIVFFNVSFPVELGLIDSYSRPGRNVTGYAFFAGIEVTFKRLSLVREVAPAAKRLSLLWSISSVPTETVDGDRFDPVSKVVATAKGLGFETRPHPLRTARDVEAAFGDANSWGAQAVAAAAPWLTKPDSASLN